MTDQFLADLFKLINFLYSSPTPDQRRDVCRAIVTRYPFLADVGGGFVSIIIV